MNNIRLQTAVLLFFIGGGGWLWHENQRREHWPKYVYQKAPAKSATPTDRALVLANAQGIAMVHPPGKLSRLQILTPVSVTQFNLWLQALANEQISPVSLTVKPAAENGTITVDGIGFEYDKKKSDR